MCDHLEHNKKDTPVYEKKYRLADYFDSWWDAYVKSPKVPIHAEQYKAVNAIRSCRTASLGVDIYACPGCGDITEVYHSCRNRFCPTCSWQDTIKWSERVKNQMLSLPHRHVVFTYPHALNKLIKSNDKRILHELLRVPADVFKDWISHKYNLDIGIISVLHTFGEVKNYHPHVHMILSWGGIDKKTGELRDIKGEYVNYEFLQAKFRCKFEDELLRLFDSGKLEHKYKDRIAFLKFIKSINNKNWILHLEPPMEIPSTVVRYIGRYSKRACLSEYKITSIEGKNIRFSYKDYKDKDYHGKAKIKELELSYEDFFPRLLQHVPLPQFRLVRYYGLYSNKRNIPENYLYKATQSVKVRETDEYEDELENSKICPYCKIKKEYQFTEIKKSSIKRYWHLNSNKLNEEDIHKRAVA
jgi:hypothetical protein